MLDLAARLALRARGRAEPNPLVGCVLVKAGEVIGMGHHRLFGDVHAEVDALRSARRQGHDPLGCTAYVTLEPCNHQGKQPPCTRALIEAGVARVIAARRDDNPVAAGGFEALRSAGIPCEVSEDSSLARDISDPFFKRVRTGTPWVIAKWAQTIDGRVATRTGESKWISSEASRRRVHALRGRVDAIMCGLGTVLADDPMLTPRPTKGRGPPRRTPIRVVADAHLDIPLDRKLVTTSREVPTLVLCSSSIASAAITAEKRGVLEAEGVKIVPVPERGGFIDLVSALRTLHADHGVATLMIEGGPGILGSLLAADLIDEAIVYIAPLLLGDEFARSVATGRVVDSLRSGVALRLCSQRAVGGDIELTYRRMAGLA